MWKIKIHFARYFLNVNKWNQMLIVSCCRHMIGQWKHWRCRLFPLRASFNSSSTSPAVRADIRCSATLDRSPAPARAPCTWASDCSSRAGPAHVGSTRSTWSTDTRDASVPPGNSATPRTAPPNNDTCHGSSRFAVWRTRSLRISRPACNRPCLSRTIRSDNYGRHRRNWLYFLSADEILR